MAQQLWTWPDTNLVGYWNFDINFYAALDYSGNENHMGVTGSPNFPAGVAGLCMELNGSTQYASVTSTDYNFTSGNFSVCWWMRTGDTTTNQRLISRGSANTDGWEARIVSGNVQVHSNQDGSRGTVSGAYPSVDATTWVFCAFTKSGTTWKLYINSSEEDSDTLSNPVDATAAVLYVGRYQSAGYEFDGAIDELRIYDTALTQNQLERIMNTIVDERIKEAHYTELQDAVHAWETAYGIGNYSFNNDPISVGDDIAAEDTGGTDVSGTLRDALDDNRNRAGLADYSWSDNPVDSTTEIQADHLTTMRTVMNDLQANRCYLCDNGDNSCTCDNSCDSDACDQCDAVCFEYSACDTCNNTCYTDTGYGCDTCDNTCYSYSCTCDNSCNSDACDKCDASCFEDVCDKCDTSAYRYPWS